MPDEKPISRRSMLRGRLFGEFARVVADGIQKRVEAAEHAARAYARQTPPSRPNHAVLHRPPGAIDEISFVANCTRCDACIDACPVHAIVRTPAQFGSAAGTPMIDARTQACVMCDTTPCIPACQESGSGVLNPDWPRTMGTARIMEPSCLAHQGQACSVCADSCPVAGAMEMVNGTPRINESLCTGCGVCQHRCPAPRNAIALIPLRDRIGPTFGAPPPYRRHA